MFVSCILGAAAMYFQLPGSDALEKAFVGAKALHERGQGSSANGPLPGVKPGVAVDRTDKTCDGFTLVTTTRATRADLLDMRGNVAHTWSLPFSKAWPNVEHVKDPLPDDRVHWFRCWLYANGDLLAVYQTEGDTPCGYGLAKMDKDSNLLWAYAGRAHHNVDVGEDGTIYTLIGANVTQSPLGLEFIPTPFVADSLVVLSPEGKELDKINILEAYRDSPFALTLSLIEEIGRGKAGPPVPHAPGMKPPRSGPPFKDAMPFKDGPKDAVPFKDAPPNDAVPFKDAPPFKDGMRAARGGVRQMPPPRTVKGNLGDVVHANSIRVLNPSMAAKFPMFQAKQVLISLRALDTIAVVDVQKRAVTWSVQGLWGGQHDPEFLANGRLLIYDNFGATKGTRVLEYDPQSGAIPWSYANENSHAFVAMARGHAQRLANGNTLIVDPDGGRIFEVTGGKELAWNFRYAPAGSDPKSPTQITITGARRYRAEELSFLKGDVRARP